MEMETQQGGWNMKHQLILTPPAHLTSTSNDEAAAQF